LLTTQLIYKISLIKHFLKKVLPKIILKFLRIIIYKFYSFIDALSVYKNFYLKRQYIYNIKNNINIETSSICNLNCIFCGYGKRDLDKHPKKTMSTEFFEEILNQVEDMKYSYLGLSPTTGDIFMDKNIFEKFEILEKKNLIGYYFYTNFIIPNKIQIQKILSLKKLKYIGISIYGHNEDTFEKITDKKKSGFDKLIQNLTTLEKKISENHEYTSNKIISLEHRTIESFNLYKDNNQLAQIIKTLLKKKNVKYEFQKKYDNWGGLIKEEDLKDTKINLLQKSTKKIGSCSLIYNRMTIGVDGTINACACRDANFTLRIGNLQNQKLKNIVSLKNDDYKNLIFQQESNKFNPVCKSCTFYTSIYQKQNSKLAFSEKESFPINLEEYKKIFK